MLLYSKIMRKRSSSLLYLYQANQVGCVVKAAALSSGGSILVHDDLGKPYKYANLLYLYGMIHACWIEGIKSIFSRRECMFVSLVGHFPEGLSVVPGASYTDL